MAGGRPSDFTQEIADEICERLSRGESLRAITGADRDDFMPGQTTVYRWLDENEEFRKQYARARELQADHYAEEIVDIADGRDDWKPTADEAAQAIVRDPQRDRLRIDARKWVASKLAPKKYGDKIAHVGGSADDEPIKTKLDLSGMTNEQLQALAAIPT